MTGDANQSPPAEELIWSCVEEGFYVASHNAQFLGFVDRIEDGVFQVCNARSEQIGLFPELSAAQDFLISHARQGNTEPRTGVKSAD